MVESLALQGQLDGLKKEFSDCKREDDNKYVLIEVRKNTPTFILHILT